MPMNNKQDSKQLLAELEQLQTSLKNSADANFTAENGHIEDDSRLMEMDNIPTLQDVFEEGDYPVLEEIVDSAVADPIPSDSTSSTGSAITQIENEQSVSLISDSIANTTKTEHLTLMQQEKLIDGLIDDMLPLIKSRLRDRVRQIIEREELDD